MAEEEEYLFDSDEEGGAVFDSSDESYGEHSANLSEDGSSDASGELVSMDELAAGAEPPPPPPPTRERRFSLDDPDEDAQVAAEAEMRDPRKCSVDLGGRRPSQVLASLKSDIAAASQPSWKDKADAANRRRSGSTGAPPQDQDLGPPPDLPPPRGRKNSWQDAAAASQRRKTGGGAETGEEGAAGGTGLGISKLQLTQLQQQHRSKVEEKAKLKFKGSGSSKASGGDELGAALQRRRSIAAGLLAPSQKAVFNPYNIEEFSRREIRHLMQTFKTYDKSHSSSLELMELKYMMEKLGHPQTHIGLKGMIREVAGEGVEVLDIKAFFEIFRRAKNGTLQHEGLRSLADSTMVNVSEVGVGGAKAFFEAKAAKAAQVSAFEQEIKEEQEQKRQDAARAKERKDAFKALRSQFK